MDECRYTRFLRKTLGQLMGEVTNNQILNFINEQLIMLESTEVIIESSNQDIMVKTFEKAMLIGQMSVVNELAKFIMQIIEDTKD